MDQTKRRYLVYIYTLLDFMCDVLHGRSMHEEYASIRRLHELHKYIKHHLL